MVKVSNLFAVVVLLGMAQSGFAIAPEAWNNVGVVNLPSLEHYCNGGPGMIAGTTNGGLGMVHNNHQLFNIIVARKNGTLPNIPLNGITEVSINIQTGNAMPQAVNLLERAARYGNNRQVICCGDQYNFGNGMHFVHRKVANYQPQRYGYCAVQDPNLLANVNQGDSIYTARMLRVKASIQVVQAVIQNGQNNMDRETAEHAWEHCPLVKLQPYQINAGKEFDKEGCRAFFRTVFNQIGFNTNSYNAMPNNPTVADFILSMNRTDLDPTYKFISR